MSIVPGHAHLIQSVAFPAIAVSTYDLISIANGLDSLFAEQNNAGQLPYAGFPFPTPPSTFSFTYHLYSLIAVSNHFLWSGDIQYLQGKWEGWKRGMAWSLGTIDETGLMNVTSSAVHPPSPRCLSRIHFCIGLAALLPRRTCYRGGHFVRSFH